MNANNKDTIQEAREINADSKEPSKDIKLQNHLCNVLHNRERLQIESTIKKI